MTSLFDFIDFTDPFIWAYHILGVFLLPAVYGALLGKCKDGDLEKFWAYRGAGFEIASILFPFFIHFLINLLSGKINTLLLSPELPMASLLLCSISLYWIMKGARATKDAFPIESLQTMQLIVILFFSTNTIIIYYLTTSQSVPSWFSIINSLLVVICTFGSFGIVALMSYASKYPDKLQQSPNRTT